MKGVAAPVQLWSQISVYGLVIYVHWKAVTTVEGIGSTRDRLHPVQQRLSRGHGSQCGFCTPGFVMAMYTLLRNSPQPTVEQIDEALQGNLCRCTGYRPILESFYSFSNERCSGAVNGVCCKNVSNQEASEASGGEVHHLTCFHGFPNYDPTQEPIFPPELQICKDNSSYMQFLHSQSIWYRPVTLSDLLALKQQHPEARIVAGNTEIGIEQKFKQFVFAHLIDPRAVPELCEVNSDATKGTFIGSAFSLAEINDILLEKLKTIDGYKSKVIKAVLEMLHWFAGKHIRNTATVAGNIATASPISDLNPLWLAAKATLVVESTQGGRREVLMDEQFFISYRKTTLKPEEVIIGLWIPYTNENDYFYGYKQAQRREDDIAIVNAGMKLTLDPTTSTIQDLRLSFGGMAPKTVMASKTMQALIGCDWNDALIDKAIPLLLEDLPLSPGVPGGMERFRQTLCLSFFFKFFLCVKNQLDSPYSTMMVDDWHEPMKATQIYQEVASGQPKLDPVHRPIMHLSGEKHTTGEAQYCDDIDVAKPLYLQFVLSERAHAKIMEIDISQALAMESIVGFVDHHGVPPAGNHLFGIGADTPAYAKDEVNHFGQPILGILGTDEELTRQAASKVRVTYQDMEPIVTIEEAIAKQSFYPPGAWTLSNVRDGNRRIQPIDWSKFDHVIDGETRVGGQDHFYLEPQTCIVTPGEDDSVEVVSSTQGATDVQLQISTVLGIPMHKIVVSVKRIGGGFGGKETAASALAVRTALAALKFRRPVRCTMERFDDMVTSGTRHPFLGRYKIAFSNSGKLQAYECNFYSNAGFTQDLSIGVMHRALFSAVRGTNCKTNIQSSTAFRGFGTPQSEFIVETAIDKVAETLRMAPEMVREMNLYHDGDRMHHGETLKQCNMQRCWNECKELSEYNARLQEVKNYNNQNRWTKRGLAMVPTKFSIAFGRFDMNQAGALVHIYTDGSVLVSHAGIEMGQGLHTKIAQIASRTLRIPIERIHINNTATDKVPNTSPTAASVGSDINGYAVQNACETLLQRLTPYVFDKPKGTWEDWVKAAYEDRVSLSTTGFYKTDIEPYNWETGEGKIFHYYVYGTACSEVEIDCLTGDHRLQRVDIVMDIGDSLNPAVDIGQIEGGFIQGYGLFTMEELKCSPKGIWYTRGPGTYKIPSADDIPRQFNVKLLQGSSNKTNIFSSKAVGEPPFFLGSSVYFAIKDAIRSARRDEGFCTDFTIDSPATAEKIRMACSDKFTEQVPLLPKPVGSFNAWTVPL